MMGPFRSCARLNRLLVRPAAGFPLMRDRFFRWRVTAYLAAVLGLSACRGASAPPPQNTSEQAAVDSLMHLHRSSLTARDPHRAMQALMCYTGVVIDEFGELRGTELARVAESRAYTWRDRAAERQRDSAIALHVFYTDCAGYQPRLAHRAQADSAYLRRGAAG
jgi:hypothetical protein